MRSEANVSNDIMIAISEAGGMIWRNNTGVLKDARGVPVRFGLCVGSSDLIGICPDGTFMAIEVKKQNGRATEKQLNFISNVKRMGGRAGVAKSIDDALNIMSGN